MLSKFVQAGFYVFPVHGIVDFQCTCGVINCKNAGKHPVTKNGLKDAKNELFVVGNNNIGIATGKISGFFVLDVDSEDGLAGYDLPETYTVTTGRGRHLYFKYPNFEVKNKVNLLPKIDVRGDGGYIVAADSTHKTGVKYTANNALITNAPSWLLNLLKPVHLPKKEVLYDGQWSYANIMAMLGYIDPDCNYEDWVKVGMSLHSENFPMSIWDNWSRCGTKYVQGECLKKWRTFKGNEVTIGTLVYMARQAGWVNYSMDYEIKLPETVSPVIPSNNFLDNIPDGLVKDIYNWILDTSFDPQPILALAATLCCVGTIKGHYVKTTSNLRTNILATGLLPSGYGKDHARKCVANIMTQAGLVKRMSGRPASVQGLIGCLFYDGGVKLLQLDEFGRLLQSIKDKNGSPHIKEIADEIIIFFSSAGTTYYGREQSNRKENPTRIIEQPCLSIYGVTIPENFYDALNSREAIDGFLSRWLVFQGSEVSATNKNALDNSVVPSHILDRIRHDEDFIDVAINPITVPFTSDANIFQENLREEYKAKMQTAALEKNGLNSLYARYWEHTVKIALVVSNDIEITLSDIQWAYSVVQYCMGNIVDIVKNHITESDFDRECKFVLSKLHGKMSHSELYRKCKKYKAREFSEIIQSLLERQLIGFEEKKTETKPIRFYFLV